VAGQQPVLPGGRNSGQKAQKGLEKTSCGQKNLWPKIGQTFFKIGQTFFVYWLENNFGTWQHWQQHTHGNS
jgi:hypothetical protein